jgi:hypothetical protein
MMVLGFDYYELLEAAGISEAYAFTRSTMVNGYRGGQNPDKKTCVHCATAVYVLAFCAYFALAIGPQLALGLI